MQYYKKRKLILYFIEGAAQPSQKVPKKNARQNPLPIYERNYEHCIDRKECLLSDIRYQKKLLPCLLQKTQVMSPSSEMRKF